MESVPGRLERVSEMMRPAWKLWDSRARTFLVFFVRIYKDWRPEIPAPTTI